MQKDLITITVPREAQGRYTSPLRNTVHFHNTMFLSLIATRDDANTHTSIKNNRQIYVYEQWHTLNPSMETKQEHTPLTGPIGSFKGRHSCKSETWIETS
jgi:hypothetical protein